jgi:AbrB family looped-hinge helix DNA binding protein
MEQEITIDASGRVVIPKEVRERHRLAAGTRLRLGEEGDRIVLSPVQEDAVAVERGGLLVFQGRLVGEVPDHRQLRELRAEGQGRRR